jgi:glycosyltransferase involved in cell wall biosynthesis
VDAFGFLNRTVVRDVLTRSVAALVTFLPLPNHIDAQSNKMFEYMSARVPVIASHFPLWREIIEGNDLLLRSIFNNLVNGRPHSFRPERTNMTDGLRKATYSSN